MISKMAPMETIKVIKVHWKYLLIHFYKKGLNTAVAEKVFWQNYNK